MFLGRIRHGLEDILGQRGNGQRGNDYISDRWEADKTKSSQKFSDVRQGVPVALIRLTDHKHFTFLTAQLSWLDPK